MDLDAFNAISRETANSTALLILAVSRETGEWAICEVPRETGIYQESLVQDGYSPELTFLQTRPANYNARPGGSRFRAGIDVAVTPGAAVKEASGR